MPDQLPYRHSNLLLDSLSPTARERIIRAAKMVTLPVRTNLFQPNEPMRYAYFITSGIASVVIELAQGGTAEVALIGHEGVVGGLDLIGPALSPAHCFIQVDATAFRISFKELHSLFMEVEEIRTRILEMVQSQSLTMSQIVACNRLHEAKPRLARWLLMVQDRVQQDTLNLTQEFLAQMLGTQRTTVVMVASAFQRSGLIEYKRGRVTIHSREDLENAACDCYKITQRLFSNLYSHHHGATGTPAPNHSTH